MEHIDLVDRVIPNPSSTVVVETPAGELVLVDTQRPPEKGDSVFVDDNFIPYRAGLTIAGVAYCIIKFL